MTKQGYTVMNCLHRYIYKNHMSTGRIVCYTHGLHGLTKTNHKNRTYAVRLLRQTTQCCSTRMFHKCCPHARKSLHSLLTSDWLPISLPLHPTQTGFRAANAQHRQGSMLPMPNTDWVPGCRSPKHFSQSECPNQIFHMKNLQCGHHGSWLKAEA